MRDVVVTGRGVVSPVGNSVDTFFDALVEGQSGIVPSDDVAGQQPAHAGEQGDADQSLPHQRPDKGGRQGDGQRHGQPQDRGFGAWTHEHLRQLGPLGGDGEHHEAGQPEHRRNHSG